MHHTTLAEPRPPATDVGRPDRDGLILTVLALAQFMVILDITVVNVALPEIGRSLELGREALTWVVAAYTLTFGGLLILGGRLADTLGRRSTFLVGLATFTAASLAAGLATSGPILLSARVGQGVGAALLSPAALSLLTTEFSGRERTRALGVWGAIGAAGAAAGVLVGGALTSGPGWRWAFFVNVPIGIAVAGAVIALIPRRPGSRSDRVDVVGALSGTGAVAALIYGLIRSGDAGWTSPSALLSFAAALALGLAFVQVERHAATPLVPLSMLRRPPLPGAVIVMVGATALMLSTFFLTSIYLQHARGYSALGTGLVFLPAALATVAGAHGSAQLIARFGVRVTAAAGLALAAPGFAVLAWYGTGGGVLTALLPGLMLVSAGIGATFVSATTGGLTGIEHARAGLASGIMTTGHEMGGSLGIAVFSSIAAASIAGRAAETLAGFENAFLTAAITAGVLAVVATVVLPRGRINAEDRPAFAH